jgi:hypothetical protein
MVTLTLTRIATVFSAQKKTRAEIRREQIPAESIGSNLVNGREGIRMPRSSRRHAREYHPVACPIRERMLRTRMKSAATHGIPLANHLTELFLNVYATRANT